MGCRRPVLCHHEPLPARHQGFNGHRPSGAETIERLAAVFGVPPDYFIEYRAWKVREIARKYPALADEVYDLLVAHAASEESRRRSRGK